MTDLLAARSQMAISLAFHIVFAIVGMGMPLLMVLAEGRWLRRGDPLDRELAQRWAKGTAIMFAVGAVSGTVLSFELGLLWPELMAFAGPILGLPFSMEGFAFFFEAIFLGVYLYGWERVPPRAHWLAGVGVFLAGTASGAFVVCANAWMNNPTGWSRLPDGTLQIDPVAAMFNPGAPGQVLHMVVAAWLSVAFAVAAVHAWYLRKEPGNPFHRRALEVVLPVAMVCAVAQPLTGHVAAEHIAHAQPAKLAAAEAQWETMARAPLRLGGWPDEEAEVTRYSVEVPGLLSLLSFGELDAVVTGLRDIPREDRPPVAVVHLAYQVMLGCGMAMLGLSALIAGLWWRRGQLPDDPRLLAAIVAVGPMGVLAVEAGWTVTEVGRQPWVVYGVMRTADAVTPIQGIPLTLAGYLGLYVALSVLVVLLLRRQFHHAPHGGAV
jgi:cytochrome d ubiquinol oxidase subunit I